VLIVEDEAPKREHLQEFLAETLPQAERYAALSVRSAIAAIRDLKPDLVLLDMSLPTFDVLPNESGGRPQGFGGIEVLRYMDRYKVKAKTIVVTAYEAFFSEDRKGMQLGELAETLASKHPQNYLGLVYYNSVYGDWRQELREHIQSLGGDVGQ